MRPSNRHIAAKIRRRLATERGVVLVLVMIFLALMLMLGLAIAQTTTTEISVGRNVYLAADAFSVADAGATHAYELVRNMRGDFTSLLKGDDNVLKSGDEFAQREARTYNEFGVLIAAGGDMFVGTAVKPIPMRDGRAVAQLDARHFYELIAYDNADDPKAYLQPAQIERAKDPGDRPDVDADQRVLIRSVGYVMASDTDIDQFDPSKAIASAAVDVVIGLTPYPAIVSNDDLEITNTVSIDGTLGGVHANDDLVLDAGGYSIHQSATFANEDADTPPGGANVATDDPHVQGFNGNSDRLSIPDLNPFLRDIAQKADYVVLTPGSGSSGFLRPAIYNALGGDASAKVAAAGNAYGPEAVLLVSNKAPIPTFNVPIFGADIDFDDSGFKIRVTTTNAVTIQDDSLAGANKTVLVIMPDAASAPISLGGDDHGKVTVITNGSIDIAADSKLAPALSLSLPDYAPWSSKYPPWYKIDLLALAGADIRVSGTAAATDELAGVMYAHEQFRLEGNGVISGQVVSYEHKIAWWAPAGAYVSWPGADTTGTPIGQHESTVSGNFRVYHDATRGYLGNFAIASWRQLRDFDPAVAAR